METGILWFMLDGTVAVTTPNRLPLPYGNPPLEGETEQAYLDRIADKAVADGVVPGGLQRAHIDKTTLPSRRFRSAWRHSGGKVDVDFATAKALLEAEIPQRAKAPTDKVARIRAGLATVNTVADLEALAIANGWKMPLVKRANGAVSGEDV